MSIKRAREKISWSRERKRRGFVGLQRKHGEFVRSPFTTGGLESPSLQARRWGDEEESRAKVAGDQTRCRPD